MNLVSLLHKSVRQYSDHVALKEKVNGTYCEITYRQLWSSIASFAYGLKMLGVRPSDKVAIMATNGSGWAISDYGILSLGAVTVPIYPTLPSHQASYILRNADVGIAIAGNVELLQTMAKLWPDTVRAAILLDGEPVDVGKPVYSFEHILELGRNQLGSVDPDEEPYAHVFPDSLATIVHTSGTSGNPKGVMLSHANIVANIQASLQALPVNPNDVALSYLPLSHIFERTVGHFALLSSGATIAYAERIETVQQNLQEVQPTLLVTVPRLLEKVHSGILQRLSHKPALLRTLLTSDFSVQDAARRGLRYQFANALVYRKLRLGVGGRMRAVVSGGASLAANLAYFFQRAGIPVYEGYGMTEASPVIAVNPQNLAKPGTVGKLVDGVEARIDVDGELLVRGPNIMRGYYGDPDETMKALTADGWLRTGDIARIEDGYVTIVERKKNIIVLATGKNVAPFPIENAMIQSPSIADAVLIGDGYKYVTCLVVPDFAALLPFAETLGIANTPTAAWMEHPKLRSHLCEEIRTRTQSFAEFEQPKRAYVLPTPFSIDNGELTPTLKVRTQVILKKYQPQIDAMYAGIDYLAIRDEGVTRIGPDLDSYVLPHHSAKPEKVPSHKRRHSRTRTMVGAALILLVLAGVVFAAQDLNAPKSLNLLGDIKHIGKDNQGINKANQQIVNHLEDVRALSSLTPKINQDLQNLDSGLVSETKDLSQLVELSQQEISLSQQFANVASTVDGHLQTVRSSSASESNTTATMASTARQLVSTARQLAQTNAQVATQLDQASQKTKIIDSEMP